MKANDVITFSQVPVGVRYQFTETANDKTASYTVVDKNDQGKIHTAKNENTLPQKDLATAEEVVNKGEEATVTFYNAKATMGSLKLIKKDGNKFLSGVTFSLTQEDGSEIGTKTTDENGEVLFEDLKEGTYTVTETKTTNGHSLLAKPFTVTIPFTIKKEDAEKQKVDTSTATLMGDTYYFYDLVYTVKNDAAPNLPKTGNKETRYLFLILAIAAIVFVEYYLTVTKKKEER